MILRLTIVSLLYLNTAAQTVLSKQYLEKIIDVKDDSEFNSNGAPSLDYELLRRRIEKVTVDLWNFVRSEAIMSDSSLELLKQHKNALLSDLEELRKNDGYDAWRMAEINNLEEIVQNRIKMLQNPKDCESARRVACRIGHGGFGSRVHQIAYCLIISYATGRTMVLEAGDQHLCENQKWEEVFLPFSLTCNSPNGDTNGNWTNHHLNASDPIQVIHVPGTNQIIPQPDYLANMAVPEELSLRLICVHSDPAAWWMGQFVKYVLRLQPATQMMIEQRQQEIQLFDGPIVGLHVRRTDKLVKEAQYHSLLEYMTEVEDYYDKLDFGNAGVPAKRRVYIASDDPSVLIEAKEMYPTYIILGFEDVMNSASVQTRSSTTGLDGIILDTHILSKCDFTVCTFSSNVCRMVYEMRTVNKTLWTSSPVVSIDSNYRWLASSRRSHQAVIVHVPRNKGEISLETGDLVLEQPPHQNRSLGMTKGTNENTGKNGNIPAFKLNPFVKVRGLPRYTNYA